MLLEKVSGPADVRAMTQSEVAALSGEIRSVIVDAVNVHGGHLGSNLGVVELTIALHRVFDSPRDVLLWDTGHQAYVHKLLTGRRADFETLREQGGLSGYPCREESDHDWVENSHASTILSYAFGLSTAFGATGQDDRRVVAVVGDGSLTGGMAFEGLNNLGHAARPVIIVLNDNGRSYAPTVSLLSESLIKLRMNPELLRQQDRVRRAVRKLPAGSDILERGWDATKAAIRQMWEPRAFFEDLGVRYAGPVDGHDLEELESALRQVEAWEDGPIVLHVLTEKGRGYAPAENDSVKKLHDVSSIKSGSYTAAFTDALVAAGERDPALVAITAAMPDSTGLLPFAERFPGRCIDVGIAEQHAVTSASGMAMGGLHPVVAVYSVFLTRAFDQVMYDVGLHRQKVVFCLDRAGITGDDGASHHGVLDLVLLTKVPNMTVFAPSSYQELGVMFDDALALEGPAALRWPKTPARSMGPEAVGAGLAGRLVRRGDAVCLVGIGKMVEVMEAVASLLAEDGVEATVWDARVIPFDAALVQDALAHPLVVSAEDGLRDGGAGSILAAEVERLAADRAVQAPATSVLGIPTRYLPHGNPDQILADLGLDADSIAAHVRSLLSGTPQPEELAPAAAIDLHR